MRIEPTVMADVDPSDPVMQEEVFGPVLPVLAYDSLDDAVDFVRARPTPLALYLFTEDRTVERRVMRHVPFGGGCVNDTVVHLATPELPFGGLGASGMGSYHGKASFDAFSHEKAIVRRATWADPPMRYRPPAAWKRLLVRLALR